MKSLRVFTAVAFVSLLSPALASQAVSATPVSSKSAAATQKAHVASLYKNRYFPAMITPTGWTGEAETCTPGRFQPEALKAMEKQVNVIRELARLSPVTLTTSLGQQQAALMMEANNSLDHDPPSSWRCYTKAGATGAGTSNLAIYYGYAGDPVDLYMDDPGASNNIVGHRRWILNPQAKAFVMGQTTHANAMKVINVPQNANAKNPLYVAWPTKGYFPTQMEPNGKWSLTVNRSNAKWVKPIVRVYRNGVKLPNPRVFAPAYGYGNPTLVWQMKSEGKARAGSYKVIVKGLKIGNKTMEPVVYTSRIFKP